MNKKVNVFGKAIPLFVFVLLGIGLVSAALLTVYGTITGFAAVEQSVIVLDGAGISCTGTNCEYTMGDSPVYGGAVDVQPITIKNRGDNQVPLEFVTTAWKCAGDGYGSCDVEDSDVISTRYYAELKLENKDPNDWSIESADDIEATLKYDLVSSDFNYELEAKGLTANTEYVLIYYADQQNRYVNWGGDNPGAEIVRFTTDADGYKFVSGSEDSVMSLPDSTDWNIDADYSVAPDGYALHSGAKIWLVPSSDYDAGNKKLTAWYPTNYLFETDMMDYSDGGAFMMNTGEIVVNIENTFNPATMPGYYKVVTEVLPYTA